MAQAPPTLQSVLHSNAQKAFANPKLSDVTFIVGKNKKEFPAISRMFAMHSTYFYDKFIEQKCDRVYTIIEEDITPIAFEYINKLFYFLDPTITAENVVDILYAANKYKLTVLAKLCDQFMESVLKANNIANILLFESKAISFGLKINHPIRQRFVKWLTVETSQQIIKSKIYLSSSKEVIEYIISSNAFSVNEEDVWMMCKSWCDNQIKIYPKDGYNCKTLMQPFIKHIRFTLMKNDFFVQQIYTSQILEIEHSMNISLYMMDPTRKINCKYIQNIGKRNHIIYGTARIENAITIQLNQYKKEMDLYKNAKVLQYTLKISNPYDGCKNSYESLTNNNTMEGCATMNTTTNEFIQATFSKKTQIIRMDIGASGNMASQGWNESYLNNRKIQWKNDSGSWIDWKTMSNFKFSEIKIMDVDIHTTSIRIFDASQGHISMGCWRFYGYDV